MESQAPVMPDAWMHPLPCPVFGVPPQRGGQFLAQGSRSCGSPRAGAPPLQTYAWMPGMSGASLGPRRGRPLMSSIPSGFQPTAPPWELEESEGWPGPSFSSPPADHAASTDTLLTGIDWLGLSGATQREGSACSRGERPGAGAQFSAADSLYSFFNPCF